MSSGTDSFELYGVSTERRVADFEVLRERERAVDMAINGWRGVARYAAQPRVA